MLTIPEALRQAARIEEEYNQKAAAHNFHSPTEALLPYHNEAHLALQRYVETISKNNK
jgi:hypothetical protein